jgi:hypothetical protein
MINAMVFSTSSLANETEASYFNTTPIDRFIPIDVDPSDVG